MKMNVENLRVLSWNANGNCNHISDRLALYTKILNLEIDVLAINEAHQENFVLPGFHSVQISSDLAVVIRNGIAFNIVKRFSNSSAELLIIAFNKVLIVFGYLRNGKSSEGISLLLEHMLVEIPNFKKVMIVGDLNCRLTCLGNRSSNTGGNCLQNFLDSMDNYVILNEPNVFTFERPSPYNSSQFVRSVLDLCIVSNSLLNWIKHFEVLESFGSDHLPIYVEISGNFKIDPFYLTEYESFYTLRSKNLHLIRDFPPQFKKDVKNFLSSFFINEDDVSADEHWDRFQQALYESLKKNHLFKTKRDTRVNNLRLSKELSELRKTNRNLFRKKIAILKQEKWHTFISSIDSEEDRASLWRKFKISRGKKRSSLMNGDLKIEVENIREAFEANSKPNFCASFSNSGINWDSTDGTVDASLNLPITLDEVKLAVKSLKNSSPGPDGISANIFKELDTESLISLASLMNKLFGSSSFPASMKQCLQIALPKSLPGEFRPITLMNSILKILEWIISQRLSPFLSRMLPKEQFGFRPKMSSIDQAAHLITKIQAAQQKKKCCGVVFLDIKKAFDRIDRSILLNDLFQSGIQGKILSTISSLLNGNVYRVVYDSYLSSEYQTDFGTPQGSLLSPMLWNFYFREFTQQSIKTELFGFADDVAVFLEAHSYETLLNDLTIDLNTINLWCVTRKIEISLSKTKFVDFSPIFRKKRPRNPIHITLHDLISGRHIPIEKVSAYRYLGVLLDENLNFKAWVQEIVQEVTARITMVLRLSKTMKLQRRNIETFYSGYVRGYIKYGSQIWSTLPSSLIEKLTIIDRKGLRMCVGALPRTPNSAIETESYLPSLSYIALKSQVKQGIRSLFYKEHEFLKTTLLENFEESNLATEWILIWQEFDLPRARV
jgi:hypothetical protein